MSRSSVLDRPVDATAGAWARGRSPRQLVLTPAQREEKARADAQLVLLDKAARSLAESRRCSDREGRYVAAHLAALRAAAAVLATHAKQRPGAGVVNVWQVLRKVAPELAEWSAVFAASSPRRALIETGRDAHLTDRDANDLLREAEMFVRVVEEKLE